jgi:hypothetical protein
MIETRSEMLEVIKENKWKKNYIKKSELSFSLESFMILNMIHIWYITFFL